MQRGGSRDAEQVCEELRRMHLAASPTRGARRTVTQHAGFARARRGARLLRLLHAEQPREKRSRCATCAHLVITPEDCAPVFPDCAFYLVTAY